LIRATRFAARFHWPLEERTQQRYDAAKENKYIEHILRSAVGHEIAQLAHEDDPLNVVRTLEKEDWLKVLHSHWSRPRWTQMGLPQLMKTRQQMVDLGYTRRSRGRGDALPDAHGCRKKISPICGGRFRARIWSSVARHRGSRQRAGEAADGEGSGDAFSDVESAVCATGDGSVSSRDGAAAGGSAEDQELPNQVAAEFSSAFRCLR
jgi:hypothetical protein